MKLPARTSNTVINLMVAVAISVVINFSYLLLLLVERQTEPQRPEKEFVIIRPEEGVLSVAPDGHGYLLYPNGDSLYVRMSQIRRLGLNDGDRIVADIAPGKQRPGAHPLLHAIHQRNGIEFDAHTLYSRPSAIVDLSVQLLYYIVLSFLVLMLLTARRRNGSQRNLFYSSLLAIAVGIALYPFAPVIEWHTGRIVCNFTTGRLFDYMLLLKWIFVIVISILYGRIYRLISRQQAIEVENEQLKNENLTTRYNMLVSQINPHFLFNSLNSLAMLVRETQPQKALTYIDQLSYTFRYIIQNGQSTLLTLEEELKFLDAYGYLFKIRYADKLFFDLEIDPARRQWQLPALSLQPLIDNAVKHNTITRTQPFHVSIRTEGSYLVVSNPKVPKLTPEPSTGIGLANLRNRWRLITGQEVEIIDNERAFSVRLPLQPPTHSPS